MPVIVVVGFPGEGKTTFVKKHMRETKHSCLAYTSKPFDYADVDCEVIRNFNWFLDRAINVTDTLAVIDEGEIVIPTGDKPPAVKIITRKGVITYEESKLLLLLSWAREFNNFVYIVFHSLRDLNDRPWLFNYTHGMIRFYTRDSMTAQGSRLQSFESVNNNLLKYKRIPHHKYMYVPLH